MLFLGWGGEPNYQEAREWFTEAALQRSLEAQYQLGVRLLEDREGWEKDEKQAIEWLIKVANQRGNIVDFEQIMSRPFIGDHEDTRELFQIENVLLYRIRAQYKLGTIFFEGLESVEPDYGEARKWFIKVTEEFPKLETRDQLELAQYKLGIMSFKGLGLKVPDYEDAFKRFAILAGKKDAYPISPFYEGLFPYRRLVQVEAQYMLGTMFFRGLGVKPDREEARKWFSRAAEGGLY